MIIIYKMWFFSVAKLRVVKHVAWALSQHVHRVCWEPQDSWMHLINNTCHPSISWITVCCTSSSSQLTCLSSPPHPPALFSASRVMEVKKKKKKAINRREAEDDELREPPLIFHFDRLSSVKRQRRCFSYTEPGISLFVTQAYVFRMN